MRISDSLTLSLLKSSGSFSDKELEALVEQSASQKRPLQDLALSSKLLSEKELTKLFAVEAKVPFVELNHTEIKHDALKLLPESTARRCKAVVFDVDSEGVKQLAMEDPEDTQALSFLHKQLGNKLKLHIATTSQLQAALDQYRGNISSELTKIITNDEFDKLELVEDSMVPQTLNLIIEQAVKHGASDIHIEPRQEFVLIRFRIDGMLREANQLPRKLHAPLVAQVKSLSELKLSELGAPQTGSFKVQVSGEFYLLRVSTLPVIDGEKVVIRIISESTKAASLPELGFWGAALSDLNKATIQPHGLVLVSGPASSGKSTTLFSLLSTLNTPGVNISTIEDGIDYSLSGANQVQVDARNGVTFSSGLKALLAQDPNIIMVGSLIDQETAELALQAALSGHLVLSALYSSHAADCLSQLVNMAIEPFLVASALRIVVSQRLVRRLCANCAQEFKPDEATLKQLDKAFSLELNGGLKRIHELEAVAASDLEPHEAGGLSTTLNTINRLWKASDEGCDKCNYSGYKGQTGIYEVLSNNTEIQRMISSNAAPENIEKTAIAGGMLSMKLDGLIKALRGQTTIEEVLRVCT